MEKEEEEAVVEEEEEIRNYNAIFCSNAAKAIVSFQ